MAELPTVGVEEELALLDPVSGAVLPRAAEVIRDCGDESTVVAESMTFMVETRTRVCRTLAEVDRELRARRRVVAEAARRHGAVAVATGVTPFGGPGAHGVTDTPRYRELARRFPLAMSTNGTCGCHVHVSVPSRQAGVEALLHVRGWLPALIALAANSPIWQGRDTGWASQRFVFASRWRTGIPPPPVGRVDQYDELVSRAVAHGAALDPRSVYYLARLSPRYPTIEVRVADTHLTVEEATAYAGLVRALVATALDAVHRGRAPDRVPEQLLRRSCWSAARLGLEGSLVDPRSGDDVPAWRAVESLVAHVAPRLRDHGDETTVRATVEWVRESGGGAQRQRRLFEQTAGPAEFTRALAAAGEGTIASGSRVRVRGA